MGREDKRAGKMKNLTSLRFEGPFLARARPVLAAYIKVQRVAASIWGWPISNFFGSELGPGLILANTKSEQS